MYSIEYILTICTFRKYVYIEYHKLLLVLITRKYGKISLHHLHEAYIKLYVITVLQFKRHFLTLFTEQNQLNELISLLGNLLIHI